jgi:hypothetical protein
MGTKWNALTSAFDLVNDIDAVAVGPGSSTDNAVARFDGTTGKLLQNSNATLTDAGALSLAVALGATSGGTGQSSYVVGDIVYASSTTALSTLGVGSNGDVLTLAAGVPSWAAAAEASPLTTKGDLYGYSTTNARIPVGTDTHVLTADSSEALGVKWSAAGSGSGDVSAAANLTDNAIIRGDGGAKGVQDSSILIDDSDNITGATSLAVGNLSLASNTVSSTDTNGDVILSPDGTGGIVAVTDLTVGNSTQDVNFTVNGASIAGTVSVEGTSATDLGGIISHRHTNTAGFGGHFVNLRSRGTHASPTVVSDGDTLSIMASAAYDGTDYAQASQIITQVDGTPGADDMPGRMMFLTSADGGQTPTEAMRIDSSQKVGIGITAPLDTLHVVGAIELDHTAEENDDHALEIVCDAAGFGDVKAVDIDYITGALAAAQDEEAILVNIDESASTGGIMAGYLCLTTAEGGATINGYETGVNVNPIVHESGTFGDTDSILNKAVDVTAALASGGAGAISIFVADNDTLTIGDAAQWGEVEIILDTGASGSGVAPTFEYSTGGAAFSAFSPADGTNGFRNTGAILWDSSTLAGWVTATSGLYEVRITRTRNSLSITPIIDELQIAALTEYKWDKDGAVNLASLALDTALTETNGGTNQSSYTQGDILYSDTSNSLAKLGLPDSGYGYVSDGTDLKAANRSDYSLWETDFISDPGNVGLTVGVSNGGQQNNVISVTGFGPGIIRFNSGTNSNGASQLRTNAFKWLPGEGILRFTSFVKITTLSDATNEFLVIAGLGTAASNATATFDDGMYFEYDRAVHGDNNWRAVTENSTTRTVVDTGVVVVAGGLTLLEFELNAAASSVEFFIDGSSVATTTTNIPSSALALILRLNKTAGTTARFFDIDYVSVFMAGLSRW